MSTSNTRPTSSTKKPTRPSERKSRFATPVDGDALEFIQAVEKYRKDKGRPFPAWTEILQIVKSLGYRKPGPGA